MYSRNHIGLDRTTRSGDNGGGTTFMTNLDKHNLNVIASIESSKTSEGGKKISYFVSPTNHD